MAGQIASLPLSLQLDSNGRPLAGCLLYLYDAGTTTPNVFYEDFATTITLSWPLVGDASGRIPMFWVVDGSYRVRLTDSAGNEVFDINSITAVGPSTGTSAGGGVSTDQIFQTGDILWQPVDGVRSGWVRGNARSIGSISSGASERANADCQNLFVWFWTNFSDTLCPVSGGRGASAIIDWSANKNLSTLDMRGRSLFGLDTMGNVAAGVNTGATSAAVAVGAQSGTIAQTHLPNVSFTITGTAADHSHASGTFAVSTAIANGTVIPRGGNLATVASGAGVSNVSANNTSVSTLTLNSGSVGGTSALSGALALTGTAASGGSGTALPILSPGRAGSYYFKL